jgi:hypothetical protein
MVIAMIASGSAIRAWWFGQRLVPARQSAQATLVVTFGKQQAQRAGAFQLDGQRTVELDVAGEQRTGRQRFAQHRVQGRRIFRAAGNLAPRWAQANQRAANARVFEQKTVENVIDGQVFQNSDPC